MPVSLTEPLPLPHKPSPPFQLRLDPKLKILLVLDKQQDKPTLASALRSVPSPLAL